MSSFAIPLSGLEVGSSALNNIANNLANLNTDGYKSESLNFGDIFNAMQGTSGNGDPIQTGSGVQVAGESSDFSNGNLTSTGIASNMAISGNGFFVVQNAGETNYTRAGDFTVNSTGQLSTPGGELVMGYPATNGVVDPTANMAPISVNQSAAIPGVATTSFDATTNLNSSAGVGANFSTPINVYDSLGTAQTLTINYTNTAPNTWTYNITIPAAATGGTGAPTSLGTGTLAFDSTGQLTTPTGSVTGLNVTGLADGAADLNLTWKLADPNGNSLITQQNATSAASATSQNGYGVGTLTGYSVLPSGIVQGQYTNGQTLALGQVAVASFANVQGLEQTGANDYKSTFASGAAVVGQAQAGGNGTITGGSVEASNVSLAAEFSEMIIAQQGYEANAKVLTTLNQVSQATVALIA